MRVHNRVVLLAACGILGLVPLAVGDGPVPACVVSNTVDTGETDPPLFDTDCAPGEPSDDDSLPLPPVPNPTLDPPVSAVPQPAAPDLPDRDVEVPQVPVPPPPSPPEDDEAPPVDDAEPERLPDQGTDDLPRMVAPPGVPYVDPWVGLLLPPDSATVDPSSACSPAPGLRAERLLVAQADSVDSECGPSPASAGSPKVADAPASIPVPALWSSGVWGGLAALGVSFLLWPLLEPLFSRLRPQDVLVHDQRRRLLELVKSRGAVALPELLTLLGIGRAAVRYHVAVLLRAGHLRVQKHQGVTMIGVPGQQANVPGVRPSPSLARLLEDLRVRPGRDQVGIARDLNVSRQRVAFLLGRLAAAGAVQARFDGVRHTYWAKPVEGNVALA